jgi:hypothetical protein
MMQGNVTRENAVMLNDLKEALAASDDPMLNGKMPQSIDKLVGGNPPPPVNEEDVATILEIMRRNHIEKMELWAPEKDNPTRWVEVETLVVCSDGMRIAKTITCNEKGKIIGWVDE